MKTTLSSVEHQRAVGKGRWIGWSVYLIVAASLFALWFVIGDSISSYVFVGWMMIGAILLWLIEDAADY